MICSHCRDVVLDMARGVGNPDEAAALEHVSGCAACRRYLQQQRELTAGLRALSVWEGDVPSEALEQRLLATLNAGPAESSLEPASPASRLTRAHWLKIAAAVVLTAGALVMWQSHGQVGRTGSTRDAQGNRPPAVTVPDRTSDAASHAAQIVAGSDPTTGAGRAVGELTAPRSKARSARPRIVPAAEFVALPAAAMLPPFERGEIVRVQIRLASLANLGFAVQPDAIGNTRVSADLLVAQDGQPRAIRLVADTQESRSRR